MFVLYLGLELELGLAGMAGIDSFFFRFGDQSNTDLLKQDEGIYQ